ncbi:MAG: hypothetical protein V4538_03660 [Bacteroidota bacterium]
MIKSFLLLFLLCFTVFGLYAQKTIRFINTRSNEVIEASIGQTLSVQYLAYNNQLFHHKNVITDITDSSITLGNINEPQIEWVQKLSGKYDASYRIILLKDIVSFRRITTGRTIAKSLLSTSILVATYVGGIDLFRYNKIGFWETLGISVGIGLTTTLITAFILPENPKYKLADGWVILVK